MHRAILPSLLLIVTLNACHFQDDSSYDTSDTAEPVSEKVEIQPELDVFGINKELEATTHRIRRNESLSFILRNNGLTPRNVHEIVQASSGIFDVRRIRAGRPLHIYTQSDTTGGAAKPRYIVYEENSTDFIRFELGDSVSVERGSKPQETRTRLVSGEINSSLYQALRSLGVDQQLTHRLAEVYAWQVDFYRIQRGDHFEVYFEEKYVDGQRTGIGRIKAAVFNHRGNNYYAFHYRQNGMDEYYDENGKSMRRQFMAAPLEYNRISSRFSHNRYHPVHRRHMPHYGTDYAAPTGTPIRAVGDGVVTAARYGRNNGNFVRIRHNSIYETGYLHMSRFADGISAGTEVEQGQIIGYVGATGTATGPHLCFRFWKHGEPVDPQRIDLPPADPIQTEHRVAFLSRKEDLLTRMDIDPDTVIQRPFAFAPDIGYSGILSGSPAQEDSTEL
ncbi:M23 family metallopeptidase [Natronogracilivirga saccharolytica]|uniref:Peptidoglycan DD-metalloendopeptidase family protein n=1 Tax=Natronogracilivirga saccharolytica TaxID=2812953 RepID=A0A8J7UWE8_9BACT|nr:peptidoglycan DD-metalloendopeptidase family protein [Natronogracilivirga saccharolytica]MBP3193591.1 peptidoglycan DD-metalloendopeptidase family protein [Natronogracilivirga saccharolytica]